MQHYNKCALLCCIVVTLLLRVAGSFVLEGSEVSYAKFRKWSPPPSNGNASILLEFSTSQPDGLLLYTDDGGKDDFFELKLVEGALRLRYNLGEGTQMMQVGRHLNDGLWHRVEIRLSYLTECSLTVDGFVTQARDVKGRDKVFGDFAHNSHVYVGGLPSVFNNRLSELSLPSVVFEPRFRGAVRNLVFQSEDHIVKPQELIEWKGLVSGPGEACERHDPCQHGGFCISTDSGPVCDCKHIDFQGAFCDKEKAPAEGTFRGGEYVGYDFRESGGEPIVSTLDEVAFLFKSRQAGLHHALLFYSGDGVDYLSLSLREGRITLSINLGSGPLDARIHPDHLRFDDGQWHSVRVHRKVQEMSKTTSLCHITASVDGMHFDRWTLAGSFTILSSNRVTVGGFDMMRPLPGIKGVTNFIGCLRKVEYRADTLRLSLLELARSGNRLVSVSGRLLFECQEGGEEIDDNFISNKIHSVSSSENVLKTLSGGTVTFTTPESFLILPGWNASRGGSLSLKIRTTEPNGLILFAKSGRMGQPDVFALELIEGQLYVHLDMGSGGLRIQGTSDPIDDGEWHLLKFVRSGRSGTISVDDISTDFNGRGESGSLDLDGGVLYLGNIPSGLSHSHHSIWSLNLKKGFVGCVRSLVVNDNGGVDLAALAQQQDIGAVRPLCQVGSAGMCVSNPCLNGGKCADGWGRFVCDCAAVAYEGAVCQRETATLTFDGGQYVTISNGSGITEGVEAQEISLRFKTSRPAGLLLSIQGLSSDFVELSVEFARVKLRVRLGDREKILTSGREVNDGSWHLIRLTRLGNHLKMQVDDIPPVTGEILTRQWVLRPVKVQLSSLTNPFTGHVQQLVVNGLRVIGALKLGLLRASFNAKIKKGGMVVNSPTSFKSKHTYVGVPQLRGYSRLEVFFQFKTEEGDGVVFYNGNGNKNDFICLELVGGGVVLYVEAGGGVWTVKAGGAASGGNGAGTGQGQAGGAGMGHAGVGTRTAEVTYNDNRWHDVVVMFDSGDPARNVLAVDGVNFVPNIASGSGGGKLVLQKHMFLDLNGVLYLGGLPDNMYDNLPKVIKSRYGFLGCLASLDLGGEYLNPTTDALVPSNMVVAGCDDANQRCTSESCSNGGTCVEQWSGPGCDCEITSYTGPSCAQESISYDFGPGRGAILFTYQEERRPDTRSDVLAFGFLTSDPDAVLVRIDSAKTSDFLEIELMDGKVRASYNMGSKEHGIGELSRRVNDRVYHVVRLTRSGSNATLQVDNWDSITRHPLLHQHLQQQQSSVFNSQALVSVGGRFKINRKNIERPFQGVLSGLVVNGLRILDMATEKDPRVRVLGEVRQITSIGSIPSSSFNSKMKDDLHYMQKTTASLTPGVNDDLVYSGDRRCGSEHSVDTDDDEDCVVGSGSSATDELITTVYVPRPTRVTTTRVYSTVTSRGHHVNKKKKKKPIVCDDEDCPDVGSGFTVEEEEEEEEETTHHHEETTRFGGAGTTTDGDEDEDVVTWVTAIDDWSTAGAAGGAAGGGQTGGAAGATDSAGHTGGAAGATDSAGHTDGHRPTTTWKTTTTTRFIPPHPPSLTPYISRGRDFDFDPNPTVTLATPLPQPPPHAPPPTHTTTTVTVTNKKMLNETIYLVEAGDSTLIIIIIIAVLMIIIVSILIIFFMCKRRDDPIYKVEDKSQQQGGGRFDFGPGAGGQGGVGPGGVGPGQGGGAAQRQMPGVQPGGGSQGGRKMPGVKEWYV